MEKRWLYVTSEELERLRDAVGGVCVIPMGAMAEIDCEQGKLTILENVTL